MVGGTRRIDIGIVKTSFCLVASQPLPRMMASDKNDIGIPMREDSRFVNSKPSIIRLAKVGSRRLGSRVSRDSTARARAY